MPLNKYTNDIAYLIKRVEVDETITYEVEGSAFYCNRDSKVKSSVDPMTGMRMQSVEEILRTTAQIPTFINWEDPFSVHYKIAFTSTPTDDDLSMIIKVDSKPLYAHGNKHRNVNYKDFTITIS